MRSLFVNFVICDYNRKVCKLIGITARQSCIPVSLSLGKTNENLLIIAGKILLP